MKKGFLFAGLFLAAGAVLFAAERKRTDQAVGHAAAEKTAIRVSGEVCEECPRAALTFDDGPSDLTLPLLDVLDRYNVKATFFNVGIRGETAETAMKETVRRGHVLAVHTYTHEFRSVYASKEAYFEDFKKEWDYIYSVTGVKPDIFRFPGGSINGFNKGTAREIINEMNRRGYTYFDWNVDSGDATGNGIPPQTIYNNVISGVQGKNKAVVLMHNTNRKQTTLDILPKIIEKLQSMGYRFDVLTNQVEPVQFRIPG